MAPSSSPRHVLRRSSCRLLSEKGRWRRYFITHRAAGGIGGSGSSSASGVDVGGLKTGVGVPMAPRRKNPVFGTSFSGSTSLWFGVSSGKEFPLQPPLQDNGNQPGVWIRTILTPGLRTTNSEPY